MKTSILSSLESFPYFTIEAVKQLLGDESGAAGTIQTALYRWMKAGQIYQLKKGVYMTRRFYDLHRADADFSPAVSTILIPQSYVSLEFILQRHAILTEVTYPTSAVTLKHTRVIENKLGTFTFRNIKKTLYCGFAISEYLGIPFYQATAAKALFDYLYLRSWKRKDQLSGYNLVEDLRLNLEDFSVEEQTEFVGYVETCKKQKDGPNLEKPEGNSMATLIQSMQNILSQKDPLLANETKRIILKEFLQAYTLDFLYNHPVYRKFNFYGGTCLHSIYGLNRLSEDIDLDNGNEIDLTNLEGDLLNFFKTNIGYADVTAKTQLGEWGIRRTTLKFPILYSLGLASQSNEALHLKVEVSQHKQISIIRKTPVLVYGRSFVAAHFSLETMMAGKMLACLERNFKKGSSGTEIKGRDFYDLLWFMQQKIQPLEEKLAKDGINSYTVRSAFMELGEKVKRIRIADLAQDLFPLFEQRSFIEAWLEGFNENFWDYAKNYL